MESKKNKKEEKTRDLNELLKIYESKDILANEEFIDCVKLVLSFNTSEIIPNFTINEKIKTKFLEKMPFSKTLEYLKGDDNYEDADNKKQNDNRKTTIEYIKYPSGIKEKITKYIDNGKIKCKEIDYSELNQKYIDKLEKNADEQLKLLIENIGFIYNSHSSIIRKIVKRPFSYKVFFDKLLLWSYYMDELDDVGKSKVLEKWLNQLKIFAEKCYEEFMNIKQVKKMFLILKAKNKINENEDIFLKYNKYYGYDEIFGIDARGNLLEEEDDKKLSEIFRDSIKLFLFKKNVINIKEELEGKGFSFIFLEELKNFAEMFWYSSILYIRIFYEGLVLFKDCFFEKYIRIQSIMISFFSDSFLEKHFIISALIYIKFLFGSYKELEILKYMQKIVIARVQVFGAKRDLREAIEKLLKENDKLENIDELVKYIEGDSKEKKKKKKKKKNKQNISLDDLNIGEKKENDEFLDDGISIMSEPDSIVESFKNEIISDTMANNGEKIKPNLSKNFLEYLDN